MPIKSCKVNGKPGYKYGDSGKCYTYTTGNEASRKQAKKSAIKQGLAIGGGKLVESSINSLLSKEDRTPENIELIKMIASEWPKTLEDYKELVALKELYDANSSSEDCPCRS